MKKSFKQLAAAFLSAAMVVTPSFTSLAVDPTTTAGTGNILAYHVDSYVVPTSISVALNPQGYKIALRDNPSAQTDYSNEQVVSLNYGIANLSTGDKIYKVKLTVNSADSGITFVDTAAAATGDTALAGQYKMYLALVPADSTAPTIKDGTAFAVTNVADGANTHNVTAANVTDVVMTGDSEHAVAFAGTGNVEAVNEFELDGATYVVKDGGALTFSSTQASLENEMEISELGGISGFTLTGAMNTKADWATLTTKSLTFTPTYEFIDVAAQAAEAAQGPAVEFSSDTITVSNLGTGVTVSSVNMAYGTSNIDITSNPNVTWNSDHTSGTLNQTWITALTGKGTVTITVTFSDDTTKTATATY